MSLVWIRTLCQRLIATLCYKRVFLVSKCLSCGHFSSDMLMYPKRSTVAPVPTKVARHRNHHKRRLTKVPVLAGITRPNLLIAVVSGACVPEASFHLLIQSNLQNPMVPTKPLEILARRGHQNYPRRWRRGGTPKPLQNTKTVIGTWHHVEAPCHVDNELGFATLLGI